MLQAHEMIRNISIDGPIQKKLHAPESRPHKEDVSLEKGGTLEKER